MADEAGLQLFLDRDRRVRTDRSGRQALISCGAVLDHLRVAMAVLGWRAHAERFPHQADREQLASITLTPQDVASPAQRLRAERYRVAARIGLPFAAPADWDSFQPVLRGVVDDPAGAVRRFARYCWNARVPAWPPAH